MRNTFIENSYIDVQFKAFIQAKDLLNNLFKAIPNAFDNIQLNPCYTLTYPPYFLGTYFYKFTDKQYTENICGFELREAIRTIAINSYTPKSPLVSPP